MRKGWSYKLKLLLFLAIVAFLTMGVDWECTTEYDPSQFTEQPPDACPSWDTDCDGISNATETNDANAYLNLDPDSPDANPSIAHGQPCNGSLENGLNLMNEGTGYWHYNPEKIDYDDWGVLHLINMIEGAGREWHNNNWWPPRISVGDMSLRYGGYWSDHDCHQNGLEVDIRYVRNDGLEVGLDIAGPDSIYYDPAATSYLMNRLIDHADIEVILYDSVHAGILDGLLLHWPGHSDHFHVRIEDPDGTGN